MKIFPVIALIVGALLTLVIQWLNEHFRLRKVRKYLIFSISTLIKNTKKTKENIDELVRNLENEPDDIPILNLPIGFNVKSIENVNYEDRFRIFVIKKRFKKKETKAEYLNKFNNAIEIVRTTLTFSMDEINALRKYDNEGIKIYNQHYYRMQEILNNKQTGWSTPNEAVNPTIRIVENQKLAVESKALAEINIITKEFFKSRTSQNNIYDSYKNLILPIFEVAKKYKNVDLINFLPAMISNCKSIISTREAFINRFKLFNENVELAIHYLEEVVEFLK